MGGFCLLVELHREGSAPAACAAVLFLSFFYYPITIFMHGTLTLTRYILLIFCLYPMTWEIDLDKIYLSFVIIPWLYSYMGDWHWQDIFYLLSLSHYYIHIGRLTLTSFFFFYLLSLFHDYVHTWEIDLDKIFLLIFFHYPMTIFIHGRLTLTRYFLSFVIIPWLSSYLGEWHWHDIFF